MKFKKQDFGKWDKEELSIIIKGYTAKNIADHILENLDIVDRLKERIKQLKINYKNKESDVLEGVNIGLLLITQLESILGENKS